MNPAEHPCAPIGEISQYQCNPLMTSNGFEALLIIDDCDEQRTVSKENSSNEASKVHNKGGGNGVDVHNQSNVQKTVAIHCHSNF